MPTVEASVNMSLVAHYATFVTIRSFYGALSTFLRDQLSWLPAASVHETGYHTAFPANRCQKLTRFMTQRRLRERASQVGWSAGDYYDEIGRVFPRTWQVITSLQPFPAWAYPTIGCEEVTFVCVRHPMRTQDAPIAVGRLVGG